jgi:hypothetical protein
MSNSQFQAWVADPRDIFALVLSESGGKWAAIKDEGYSAKLKRNYYSFGLFQNSEIWSYDRYKSAPTMIGPTLAATMRPFPNTATWSREEAAIPLMAVPQQLGYAMVLLRSLSKFKNTYFDGFDGVKVVPTQNATKLPSASERLRASQIATLLTSQATLLRVPASAILTKAFWLASSPGGVLTLINKPDSRLATYAGHWNSL